MEKQPTQIRNGSDQVFQRRQKGIPNKTLYEQKFHNSLKNKNSVLNRSLDAKSYLSNSTKSNKVAEMNSSFFRKSQYLNVKENMQKLQKWKQMREYVKQENQLNVIFIDQIPRYNWGSYKLNNKFLSQGMIMPGSLSLNQISKSQLSRTIVRKRSTKIPEQNKLKLLIKETFDPYMLNLGASQFDARKKMISIQKNQFVTVEGPDNCCSGNFLYVSIDEKKGKQQSQDNAKLLPTKYAIPQFHLLPKVQRSYKYQEGQQDDNTVEKLYIAVALQDFKAT